MNARATVETKSLLKEAPEILEPDSSGFFAQ